MRLASSSTGGAIRMPMPRRSAARAWADGVDVLLWGHFHRLWQCSDGDRQAMIVPAWLDTTQALAVDANGVWSLVDASLVPCDPPPPTR